MKSRPHTLQIKTADGRSLALVGKPGRDVVYLAVPGDLSGDDTDHVMASRKLLRWLEEAARRVRASIEPQEKQAPNALDRVLAGVHEEVNKDGRSYVPRMNREWVQRGGKIVSRTRPSKQKRAKEPSDG